MKTHDRTVEKKKHECTICGKGFRQERFLDTHLSKHTEKTAAEWEERERSKLESREAESKRKSSEIDIYENSKISTKRKQKNPEKVLEKVFLDNQVESNPKYKLRAKSFSCKYCGDTFRLKSILKWHLKVHDDDELVAGITNEYKDNSTDIEIKENYVPQTNPSDDLTGNMVEESSGGVGSLTFSSESHEKHSSKIAQTSESQHSVGADFTIIPPIDNKLLGDIVTSLKSDIPSQNCAVLDSIKSFVP